MVVYKNFHFAENCYTVQIRSESYDILNHHNDYPIVSTTDYAELAPAYNVNVIKGSPTGANNPGTDERRNVQLALRLEF